MSTALTAEEQALIRRAATELRYCGNEASDTRAYRLFEIADHLEDLLDDEEEDDEDCD